MAGGTSSQKLDMEDTRYAKPRSKAPMVVIVIFVLVAIALAIALAVVVTQNKNAAESAADTDKSKQGETTTKNPQSDVCMTAGCVKAASHLIQSMDDTVDPCDDFFRYSCGNWLTRNLIPEQESSYDTFLKLFNEVNAQLKGLLEEDNSPSDPVPVVTARNMYKACMDVDMVESRGLEPLYELHRKLGGWPMINSSWEEDKFDLLTVLTDLLKVKNAYLLDVWVTADDKDSNTNIAQLDQPKLNLPGRDYYLLPAYAQVLQAYRTYMMETAVFLNGTKATLQQDVDDVIDFEVFLANITVRDEDRRDAAANYHRYTVGELYSNISSEFDWLVYLNKLFSEADYIFTNETEVVVYSPVYLRQMAEKLQTTPDRTIANYLLWRITSIRIKNLPKSIRDIAAKLRKVVYGTSTEPPKWQECAEYVDTYTGFAVGRLFVNKYFNADAKSSALEMIEGIKKAFDDLLEDVEWMDDETRAVAKEKSAAISGRIGFPDRINNDTALDYEYRHLIGKINPSTYFENFLTNLEEAQLKKMERIKRPVDRERWVTTPSVVNAFYTAATNSIVFPAGILQPPFWQQDRPAAMNYGGVGMVIGHEITHGFDDQGRQFDKDGNLVEWWNQEVTASFKEKADCIIDQYGSYVMSQINKTLNGINTQGENIADNGGIKQAYQAFLADEEKNGPGQTLPGLPEFSSKKLFFMSFGQIWCSAYRDEGLSNAITTGVHSPGLYRVIGTLSNFEEFAKVFQCPSGSRMNPEKRCSIW